MLIHLLILSLFAKIYYGWIRTHGNGGSEEYSSGRYGSPSRELSFGKTRSCVSEELKSSRQGCSLPGSYSRQPLRY